MTMNSTGRPTSLTDVGGGRLASTVSGPKGLPQAGHVIFEVGSTG